MPNREDMLQFLKQEYPSDIARGVYKYTDCGASAHFPDNLAEVHLSSIIEGVEQCTETHVMKWPFTWDQWWAALKDIESEAGEIWNATHGCDNCGPEDDMTGYRSINPDCKTCHGEGAVI